MNQELEAFSYSVSHDLRAPLRHIHGYVEMLRAATDGQLSDKATHYLKTITDASVEMGELIDDLLAFSRVGRAEIRGTSVELDELVQDVIRGLEMATNGRAIVWQIAAAAARSSATPSLLKQVLTNLIDNAVKYSRTRDPATIEIGCAGEEAGRVVLFVRDNGVGFDMQYAHKLFGVFQRLHRAEEFEGTGIGLATVRRIVGPARRPRLGGRRAGRGRHVLFHAGAVTVCVNPAQERPRMNPLKRILLVEDSARDAELILDALEGHQLANEVVHVRDGAEALDYLYRRGQFAGRSDDQPALMLLDLKLPKVDGLEVLRQIKGDAALKMIPVVMMTSSRAGAGSASAATSSASMPTSSSR